MTQNSDRWNETWAKQKKEELTSGRSQPNNQANPPAADRRPKEYGHGWDSTGSTGNARSFRSYVTNANNAVEGAKFQANKDTPKDRRSAHRQLDAAMQELEQARRIVEEDRQGRTGNGFLDFLGLNFDNPSDNREKAKPKSSNTQSKESDSKDVDRRTGGKTGNGFLDFLGLNFDNPSDRHRQ